MIPVGVLYFIVFPETFVIGIVIHIKSLSGPAFVAFNTKMIIGFLSQPAVATARFENALRQCDGCRNMVLLHLINCDFFIQIDICLGADLFL